MRVSGTYLQPEVSTLARCSHAFAERTLRRARPGSVNRVYLYKNIVSASLLHMEDNVKSAGRGQGGGLPSRDVTERREAPQIDV